MLKKVLPAFLLIVAILFYVLFSIRYAIQTQDVNAILDKFVLTLEAQVQREKMDAMKMAISFSKNSALIDALERDDEDFGYKVLSDITHEILENTNINIRVQILTSDYHIFARSWDDIYTGMPLEDFRSDLEYFKHNKTPRSSIETGRLLSIKTTVPIVMNEKVLGFVEIIGFFDTITDFFKNMGIDLYVLMDDAHLERAVFMQENEMVGDHVVANRNYNHNNIALLKNINFTALRRDRVLRVKDNHVFYETMRNGNGDSIGIFAFVLREKYLNYFKEEKDEASFFINLTKSSLYEIVQSKEQESLSKEFLDMRSLLQLREQIPKEQMDTYKKKLHEKLDGYTKEELMELLLEQKIIKKVDGKIR